jgi:hypothetical protein
MASNLKKSTISINASTDAITALCNSGYLRIYGGVQPDSPEESVTGQTLLAELRFAEIAFEGSLNGVGVANNIVSDISNKNSGKATWFRVFASDGSTAILDGSIGRSGCDINMNTVNVQKDARTDITSFSISTIKNG